MQQLLVPGDPPHFRPQRAGQGAIAAASDHASKAVPRRWAISASSEAELSRHIGWDIGGLDSAIALAEALDAPLVASGLFAPGHRLQPLAGRRGVDARGQRRHVGAGQQGTTKEQIDARAEACFWPYHREVDRHLDRMTANGAEVALLVMHSFTPQMKGFKRPLACRRAVERRRALARAAAGRDCVATLSWWSATTSLTRHALPTNTALNAHARTRKLPHARWKAPGPDRRARHRRAPGAGG